MTVTETMIAATIRCCVIIFEKNLKTKISKNNTLKLDVVDCQPMTVIEAIRAGWIECACADGLRWVF